MDWVVLKARFMEHIIYGEETLAGILQSNDWEVVVENESVLLLGRIR